MESNSIAINIVLITTGQPSTNPRMVKEYFALKQSGYNVKVLYSYWAGWAIKADDLFFEKPEVDRGDFILVGGDPFSNQALYFVSRLLVKAFKYLSKFSDAALKFAISRNAFLLNRAAARHSASLYIAHNLGALSVAALAAKRNSAKYAFDAEDYHRGETNSPHDMQKVKLIEDYYIPHAAYVSAASPLIAKQYLELYPEKKPIVINNVFSLTQQPAYHPLVSNDSETLKLFWFSQTIGLDRGLQDIIKAINLITTFRIQLTLLGSASEAVTHQLSKVLVNNMHAIVFEAPVPQDELINKCAHHHIGLALEIKETINRDICLTNKIFTYLLAGNAIIASDTSAQQKFLENYPGIGVIYKTGDSEQLAGLLSDLRSKPEKLNAMRRQAYTLAATELNWEKEQQKLLGVIEKICKERS